MTPPTETSDTTVSKVVSVKAPITIAFEVFTARFDAWWPRSHHVADVEMAEAILEPHAGGRWYERGIDGSECEWGVVLDFDPPNHVAVSWRLNGDFKYDPDPAHSSRVDVRFTSESTNLTRVELVHSELDRHGDTWRQLRDGIDSDGGWTALLDAYAAIVTTETGQ